MDIVSRLKSFLQESGIPNSQFADACRIPRPTLSQILNGRNKKISDELISKIHEAFPKLSIMWLMFGEGEMGVDGNIEISGAQKGEILQFEEQKETEPQPFDNQEALSKSLFENSQNRFSPDFSDSRNSFGAAAAGDSIDFSTSPAKTEAQSGSSPLTTPLTATAATDNNTGAISIATDSTKKITNIVVFYSDNSFQSFSPSER